MGFAKFMSFWTGRTIRIIAGLALIWLGLAVIGGVGGWILAIVGLVPTVAGLFNFCIFAPLFGGPLQAKDIH